MIVFGIISRPAVSLMCRAICPNLGFQDVAENGETAIRVAIKRAVADRELGFIAGRKQQPAFGI